MNQFLGEAVLPRVVNLSHNHIGARC